jgi:hypothetical protein
MGQPVKVSEQPTQRHRGADPEDERSFGAGRLPDLRRAVHDVSWLENRIIMVPLRELTFPEESPSTFQLVDPEGQVHRVPFHRVREVYKDAQRIWRRPDPNTTETE